ncbi:MAG: energy-coupling factor transporter transmembrane protein EcfT [Clostridia bacterium]|nr:energy-coupling factor transporter transmembrane protein EcfT [Clostridia bacterium]
MINIFNYIERQSPIHRLTGATKLVCFLLWSFASMVTYDTRILAVLPVAAVILFGVSKIRLKDVKFILSVTAVFMVLNNLLVFLFSPMHGCEIYGSVTELFRISARYVVTREQLWYHLNLVLKYLAQIPMLLLFVTTTDPSEFAASLNKIGVNYKIAYSVALALRYIPDIQREYHDISLSQQARGIEMSKKESLVKRLKAASAILIPLILSSMDRIEIISNAMELRGFGKGKKRSWYMARPFTPADILSMIICGLLLVLAIIDTAKMGTRFWYPWA